MQFLPCLPRGSFDLAVYNNIPILITGKSILINIHNETDSVVNLITATDTCRDGTGGELIVNPESAEYFLYKPWRPKGFLYSKSSQMSK